MAAALANLSEIKEWLGVTTQGADSVLTRLLASVSAAVLSDLNRTAILPAAVKDTFDGTGQNRMLLSNWPVTSVQLVTVDGAVIPPAASWSAPGWYFDEVIPVPDAGMTMLKLRGYAFSRGSGNVSVNYTAGYQVAGEAATIPVAPHQVQVAAPHGPWGSDLGVSFVLGAAALEKIASGTPATGQYTVDGAGKYTFAAADANKAVLISYGYVPGDISLAVVEWVSERFRYRDRIGTRSKSLGGQETVSYDNSPVPGIAKSLLRNFRRVVPC